MASAQWEDFKNGSGGRGNPFKRRCGLNGSEFVDAWVTTELEQEEFSFSWTIKNYSAMMQLEEVKSPLFLGGAESKHEWQLKIHPKKNLEGTEYFGLHLTLAGFGDGGDFPSRKIQARFQFSLLDSEGIPQMQTECSSILEFEKEIACGYDNLLLSSELLNCSRRLTDDDTLRVHLRVWIVNGLKHKRNRAAATREDERKSQSYKGIRMLAFDMGNLFKGSVMTDIKVRTDNGTFKAHKHVLAARSPVFAAMFALGPTQKPPNEIFIGGFDNAVVQDMLQYLYTGEAQLLEERAAELLQIAEKCGLIELKESCESVLVKSISITNAAALLLLGHGHKANLLKSRAIGFINRNHEILQENQQLKDILQAHSGLAFELYLGK
ncbi:unnamed protein product [Orchesella dallaii]|uniref:BTB domain-containing protein n=1 Tax=Orchesella dallaii TaxID=48710 RepID=A0ABP1QYF1_9HEXA